MPKKLSPLAAYREKLMAPGYTVTPAGVIQLIDAIEEELQEVRDSIAVKVERGGEIVDRWNRTDKETQPR